MASASRRFEELIALADRSGKAPRFNIETKISPDAPSDSPDPETFARLVVEAMRGAGLTRRTTIQSFDWRTLLEVKKRAPEIETICLTYAKTLEDRREGDGRKPSAWLAGLDPAAHGGSVPRLVAAAGCGTWSPYFRELNAAAVTEAHALSLKVVPWTVNSAEDMAAHHRHEGRRPHHRLSRSRPCRDGAEGPAAPIGQAAFHQVRRFANANAQIAGQQRFAIVPRGLPVAAGAVMQR